MAARITGSGKSHSPHLFMSSLLLTFQVDRSAARAKESERTLLGESGILASEKDSDSAEVNDREQA